MIPGLPPFCLFSCFYSTCRLLTLNIQIVGAKKNKKTRVRKGADSTHIKDFGCQRMFGLQLRGQRSRRVDPNPFDGRRPAQTTDYNRRKTTGFFLDFLDKGASKGFKPWFFATFSL